MSKRSNAIDMLRGIAVLLVIFHHLERAIIPQDDWFGWVGTLAGAGWIGVDLFFVLSGYLVSGLIFKEINEHTDFDARRFLIRRGLKIYPGFYLMLLLSGPILFFANGSVPSFGQFVSEAFYVQNYFSNMWGHTWSLAIEEQFYLIMAAGFWIWSRFTNIPLYRLPQTLLAFCVFILISRFYTYLSQPFDIKTHVMATHLRIDALGFGVLIGYFHCFYRAQLEQAVQNHKRLLAVSSLILMSFSFFKGYGGWHVYTLGLTFLYLGSAGMLLLTLTTKRFTGRNWLSRIGYYSYSIYLWHIPVKEIVAAGFAPTWIREVSYVALSLLAGIAMARLVELPALRWRDRLFPSRSESNMQVSDKSAA
jgi:peptidoglycan/LPS O-acetylase OafA/YrhL